jgi:hypothetical protein
MAAPTESQDTALTIEDSAGDSVEELRAQLSALQQENEAFRVLARDRAIKGFRTGDWGLDSLNYSLARLGLERYEPQYVSRSTASLEFQLQVDDGDSYRAETTFRHMANNEIREALRQAVASVLNERTVDGFTVTMTDAYFRVYTGDLDRVMV